MPSGRIGQNIINLEKPWLSIIVVGEGDGAAIRYAGKLADKIEGHVRGEISVTFPDEPTEKGRERNKS